MRVGFGSTWSATYPCPITTNAVTRPGTSLDLAGLRRAEPGSYGAPHDRTDTEGDSPWT